MTEARIQRSNPVLRVLLAILGIACVVLATIGVLVPGMPTTIFLILASILFLKSFPALRERLVRARIFRPYQSYLEPGAPMPRRAKRTALLLMWGAVTISCVVLIRSGTAWWIAELVVGAAVVGTVVIVRYPETAPEPAAGSPNGSSSP